MATLIDSMDISQFEHASDNAEEPQVSSAEIAIPLIELRDIHRVFKTDGGVEVHA